MIALYHLFSGISPTKLAGIEPILEKLGIDSIPKTNQAILVGTSQGPASTVKKPDGTKISTIWGEMAWQLGGTISTGDKWYGEGGVFWVQKSNEITENTTDFTFKTELSGLRIPVMVGYHLLGKETGMAGLRAFGGASVFILTSVSAEGLTKDDFTSPTYGVFLGAGIDIAMFFVDLKYEWSLSDVVSISSIDVGQSRTFYINGGIRLSL